MKESDQDFLLDPKVLENYSFLQAIGVLKHIDRLNQEIKKYQGLIVSAGEIFNCTSADEIMDAAVWQISDLYLPSFVAFIWKPLQNRNDVTIKGYQNYKFVDLHLNIENIIPLESFFLNNQEPAIYDRLRETLGKDPEAKPILESFDRLVPELVIPILGPKGGLYGIILVGTKLLTGKYTASELLFLRHLMSFVSQAIQNHIHYEYSLRDVKTGLFNYGFFNTRLNEEVSRVKRSGHTSSLIVIDVDKFKDFNDGYGHLAGDKVLEYIARTIKQSVRTDDVPSRFGGEEFTILLPNTDGDVAWNVAERLRVSISSMAVPWDPLLPQVTISLGITSFNRGNIADSGEIIHRADEALYQSKENGRNRTTVWQDKLLSRAEKAAVDV
ncbi:MAG: sensor domain-containing diguanylate cyclase [Treponema sp.]|jgi:diguanylate cyclase (GGDEF)-like protein|nr:sensor domain-containing diguanylate cyclase [Treponema sp.]